MTDTPQEPELLRWLSKYATELDLQTAPETVPHQAALCLLDTVGCIIAGANTPEARAFIEAERQMHGPNMQQWSPDVLARTFGYLGDVLELNDLIGGHSSIGVVSAALSLLSRKEASGNEMLRAITVGTEITARLYASSVGSFKPYSESGAVMVSYFNAVGAAAALSCLSDFDRAKTMHSMAIAATVNTWCPAEVIFGQGGTIKPILFGGNPASSAIQAVHYAAQGLTGPETIIESPLGLMTALAEDYDPAAIRDDESWYITSPHRKLHAACGYTHSSIDAAHSAGLSSEELERLDAVEVTIPEYYVEAVGKVGEPQSSNDARFHLGYLLTLALQGQYPILPEHTLKFEDIYRTGRTSELASKVKVVGGTENVAGASKPYNLAEVTMRFDDGTSRQVRSENPKGAPENPLSSEDVVDKFLRLVTPVTSEETANQLAQQILQLRDASDVSFVTQTVLEAIQEVPSVA